MVGNSLSDTPIPVKRGRGRPRKSDAVARQGDEALTAPNTVPKQKKPRRKKGDLPPPVLDSGYVGQPVSGVVDGSFDAGYFVTVRIGDTDAVLRGVLFGPGFSMPQNQAPAGGPLVPQQPQLGAEEPESVLALQFTDTPESSPTPLHVAGSLSMTEPMPYGMSTSAHDDFTATVTLTEFSDAPVMTDELDTVTENDFTAAAIGKDEPQSASADDSVQFESDKQVLLTLQEDA